MIKRRANLSQPSIDSGIRYESLGDRITRLKQTRVLGNLVSSPVCELAKFSVGNVTGRPKSSTRRANTIPEGPPQYDSMSSYLRELSNRDYLQSRRSPRRIESPTGNKKKYRYQRSQDFHTSVASSRKESTRRIKRNVRAVNLK